VATPSHPILSNLGVTIRLLRQQRGLSQEALAHLAAIDRSYMSGIERGRRNLSVLNMARIAGALRVPLSELLQPTMGGHVAIHQLVGGEPVQRATEAVDELVASLRIYRTTRSIVDEWKPGEYLSLC
jgi:transcriptional regulator with XRE-family HTH domain